jgi:hypothetical protein
VFASAVTSTSQPAMLCAVVSHGHAAVSARKGPTLPEPFEKGDYVAGLRVVSRERHEQFKCHCTRCKKNSIIAARSLRLRKAACQRCFPLHKTPRPRVYYDNHRGWLEVQAA